MSGNTCRLDAVLNMGFCYTSSNVPASLTPNVSERCQSCKSYVFTFLYVLFARTKKTKRHISRQKYCRSATTIKSSGMHFISLGIDIVRLIA